MMPVYILMKGLILGMGMSLPIGPVGILCLRQSLLKGPKAGFLAGLGAATADLIYATCAAFGISYIIAPLQHHKILFHGCAGLFLILFGLNLYFFPQAALLAFPQKNRNSFLSYFSMLLFTLSNPTTILLFGTLFTLFGMESVIAMPTYACLVVFMIFSGACLGWLCITSTTHYFRGHITAATFASVNTILSACIILCGIATLISCLF